MVLQLTKDCKRFYSIAGMNFKGISTLSITSWIVHAILYTKKHMDSTHSLQQVKKLPIRMTDIGLKVKITSLIG